MYARTLYILVIALCALCNFNAFAQPATVWLVRHAEKMTTDPTDRDPGLTTEGSARASDLAQVLKGKNINAIYTTNFKRTLGTAVPLMAAIKIEPQLYDAKDPAGLVSKIMKEDKGKNVLIVGHSNTLIPLIKALGCDVPWDELKDTDYDMLFKVSLNGTNKPKLAISYYGQQHHQTAIPSALKGRP
jgi:2,3-bisphosphoglycerate-dependent phosphoglycerate mutase